DLTTTRLPRPPPENPLDGVATAPALAHASHAGAHRCPHRPRVVAARAAHAASPLAPAPVAALAADTPPRPWCSGTPRRRRRPRRTRVVSRAGALWDPPQRLCQARSERESPHLCPGR